MIVTWFARDHGRIKTVARGARRPKSAFAGRLDLFYLCDIQFSVSQRSELHALREVSLLDSHEAIGQDFRKTRLASYFVELIELVTELDHPAPEIYDLLLRALDYLENQPASKRALEHFEAETARLLGLAAISSPAMVIGQITGRLPADRKALLESLSRKKAGHPSQPES